MQLEAVFSGLIAGAAAGFISGGIFGWLSGWQYSAKLIELERKINQLWGSFSSEKGVAKREEMSAEVQEVMLQAAAIWKTEGDEKEKINKLLGLATQHPAVAMRLMKQFGVKL